MRFESPKFVFKNAFTAAVDSL